MRLAANSSWFTANLNGNDAFAVYAFSGRETISEPYEFTLELVHPDARLDLTAFIGAPSLLTVYDRSGAPRLVHGLVREMRRLKRGNRFTHYHCVIVPRIWFLGQNRDHRIFQHKSVTKIITQILEEQGFAPETYAFKCFTTYPDREYCVQYGESDLYFISRLCEEEGIYYYFEHSENGHCLCFSDMPGGPDIPGESALRCFSGSGQPADTAVVARLQCHVAARGDAVAFREWNFEKPWADLAVKADEPDFAKAPTPAGLIQEHYRYPHLYQMVDPGTRYADLQLKRELSFGRWIEGSGDVARFLPGFIFSIRQHPRLEINNEHWWVTSVFQQGEQPQVLQQEAPDRGVQYHASFQAIPDTTRFVPGEAHPKVRIPNKQTAIVTGPAGEEIYPDAYGRVKVQFFWDREGRRDENSSCWIRVSQGWAGSAYGGMAVPRIGQEVIVSFLEGDPDRPLITGRVYHAGNMPPYELPAHKTRTLLKSMSTPGGKGARGFNEIRVEDKTGEEEIYFHAEKDVNIHVKNDWKEHILRDRHRTTDGATYTLTRKETHEILKEQRKSELFDNDNLTVHQDSHSLIEGSWFGEAGRELHLESGVKLVMEAGSELTLKAAGSWVRISDAGVEMDGPSIDLNCGGAPGSATPSAPELPELSQQNAVATRPEENGECSVMAPATQHPPSTGIQNLYKKCSPTLVKDIEKLKDGGWEFIENKGKGSFMWQNEKQIYIDPDKGELNAIIHEVGHANTPHRLEFEVQDECVEDLLYWEGEATLYNMQIRQEIKKNCNVDISISGNPFMFQMRKYEAVYQDYIEEKITYDEAVQKYAEMVKKQPTSTNNKTYLDEYMNTCKKIVK